MHKFFPNYPPRAKRAANLCALVGGAPNKKALGLPQGWSFI
jgi:hypothetical protein